MNSMQDTAATDINALWDAYRLDKSAERRDQIVEHYLPLVNIIAGRIAIGLPSHVDRDDLISSGFFGLLDAIERYEPSRGNKFETYGGVRIRGAILDYLRAIDWMPVSKRQKIRKYEQAVADLEGKLGRAAKDDELASALNISKKELTEIITQSNVATIIPLEEYVKMEAPTVQEGDPEESVERSEIKDILAGAIDELPEKERIVVSLYYYEELTLKEISLILHLSEARISQLHTKAVFRLRGALSRMKESVFV